MKSNFFYEFIRYVSIFLIIISLFVFILTLSSMFPSKEIYNNVKYSSDILIKEGNRKKVYIPYKAKEMEFDNYTDALMINNAYSIDYQTPLLSSMIVRKNYIPDVTNVVYKDTIGELKSSSKYDKYNPVGELKDFVNGEKAESFEYARYWHGYLSVLRPLLTIFNITQLRYILSIVLILLVIILIHSLYKKTNIIVSIIYFFSLFSVEYFYLGFSLQGIFVFLISLIGTIVLIKVFDKIGNYGCIFFVVGMLANFFDFLTVPIVTLALPLITYFLLKQRKDENYTFKMQVVDFISLCLYL